MKILWMRRCCSCLGPTKTPLQRVALNNLKVVRNLTTKRQNIQVQGRYELMIEKEPARRRSSDQLSQTYPMKLQENPRFSCTISQSRTHDKNLLTIPRNCFLNTKNSSKIIRSLCSRSFNTLQQSTNIPNDKEIEEHLKRNRIPFKNGYTSIIAPCPACRSLDTSDGQKKDGKNWNLFINKTTGRFICKKCAHSGSWNEIKVGGVVLDMKKDNDGKVDDPKAKIKPNKMESVGDPVKIFEKAKDISEADEHERKLICKRFHTEIISTDTLKKFNIRVTNFEFLEKNGSIKRQKCLLVPWYDITSKNIIAVKLIPLETELAAKVIPRKYSGGLFGSQCISKATDKIVLTSEEFDAMAVSQSTGLNVVSLPSGTSTLPPEEFLERGALSVDELSEETFGNGYVVIVWLNVLPQLEQFEKIILWFGNDSRSKQAINQFSKKLDMERCSFVRLMEPDSPDGALEALNKGLNLKSIISKAQSLKHKEILTFGQLREDVLGEFINADQAAGVKWKRFPGLTGILKGHRRGELTILTGQTGTGKTTLLSELSLDLCSQGVNTLWGSFEIKNVRLVKAMMCQYSGLNLETSIGQYNFWADKFDSLSLYFMSYFGAHSVNTVLETMAHAAYVYDIEHVIIDNLQFMLSTPAAKFADRFSAMDLAITALRNFASSTNVHVTLVIHPRKENQDSELQTASIFGTAKASQEADNILILQDTPGRISRRYLQVTKNRFDGAIGKVPLQFNKESLCMSGFYRDQKTGEGKFMISGSQGHKAEK